MKASDIDTKSRLPYYTNKSGQRSRNTFLFCGKRGSFLVISLLSKSLALKKKICTYFFYCPNPTLLEFVTGDKHSKI